MLNCSRTEARTVAGELDKQGEKQYMVRNMGNEIKTRKHIFRRDKSIYCSYDVSRKENMKTRNVG